MSFIKKKFNLNGHAIFHTIIDNKQLHHIDKYHAILNLAKQDAQNIIDAAHIEANEMIEQANQNAHDIVNRAEAYQASITQDAEESAQTLLNDANAQVTDIISNSEQNAAQAVWDQAQNMIEQLQNAHDYFYEQTKDLVKGLLATIIKRLTQNLTVQERMYILVDQVFEKAKNIEYATLFFSTQDFQNLPTFHIPQTWKIEKDNMLDVGWVKLVGAGGEWKTSITSIQSKILKSIDYKGEALIEIPEDSKEYVYEQSPEHIEYIGHIENNEEHDIINPIDKPIANETIEINDDKIELDAQPPNTITTKKPRKTKSNKKEIEIVIVTENQKYIDVDTSIINTDVNTPKPKRTRAKKTPNTTAE